jgi:hypothetical protein
MEYLAEESIEAVALYGPGVLISVPPPMRYAIHKLLVAQERKSHSPKRNKDLKQAKDLIDVFVETDSLAFEDALDDARNRGSKWKKSIDASLREIKRDVRQSKLPLALRQRGSSRKQNRK